MYIYSLDAIIRRYKKEEIVEGYTLNNAVCRVSTCTVTVQKTDHEKTIIRSKAIEQMHFFFHDFNVRQVSL